MLSTAFRAGSRTSPP